MCQRFLKYCKDNGIVVFLKYDGERTNNLYTVILLSSFTPEIKMFKNTDDPLSTYIQFLRFRNIEADENNVFYKRFIETKEKLCSALSEKVVFCLTYEVLERTQFKVYISYMGNIQTLTKQNYTDIDIFINEYIDAIKTSIDSQSC